MERGCLFCAKTEKQSTRLDIISYLIILLSSPLNKQPHFLPFDEDAPVGENAVAYLGLDDSVVEYEITSNRVDCFSVLGIAREAAATFHKEFVPPVVTETGNNEDVNDYIKVSVKDQDLCSRYTARVVKNIKFAPSPKWMQERLRAHGIRPINNLVDITNYVMEEYGQPMHAYDLDTIEGKEIIVRRAAAGEKFVTLDGQERQLDENVLMICDAKKAVGIAGIMGGENSTGSARIFGKNQIRLLQNANSPECHIFQISYRSRHYIKFSHIRNCFN